MIRAAPLLVLLLLPAQSAPKNPGLTLEEKSKAKEIVERYFKEKEFDARERILAELEPFDPPSKADLAFFTKHCFQWARIGIRHDGKNPAKCTDPKYPGEYLIVLPSGAKQGAKVGLFISLHGGGAGNGDGSQIQGLFGTPAPGLINIFPTVTQKTATAWNTEREEQYVLAIFNDLKRTYNLDTNRIYIAGHSMGGFGTWSIGGKHADLFAAASAMAGGSYGAGVHPNYKNLPIWFYHSTDDAQVKADSDIAAAEILGKLKEKYGPFDFVWKLYHDIGHGTPKEGVKPIFDWMLQKKRDPLPKHVVWEPSRAYKRHFFWLKSESNSLVEAKRDGNTFTVTGGGSGLWIYLNDKMCKLDKPVVVKEGDREIHNAIVSPSLVALVDSIGSKNDPEMIFTARIRVK